MNPFLKRTFHQILEHCGSVTVTNDSMIFCHMLSDLSEFAYKQDLLRTPLKGNPVLLSRETCKPSN